MDINAGAAVGILCHDARNQRHIQLIKLMCDAVRRDGGKSRIAQDDFLLVVGRRITLEKGLQIGVEVFTDFRDALQEFDDDILCLGMQRLIIKRCILRAEF